MPHHITVDMGETHKIHGLRVIKRLGFVRGNPKKITIDVSSDGENWVGEETYITTFDVEDENRFYLTSGLEARYFRLTITESFGEPGLEITHIAEVYAF